MPYRSHSEESAPLWVSRLALTAFRNYRNAVATFGSASVVLVGANGAGKTNVLEALSLLTPGRGLRNAPLNDFVLRDDAGKSQKIWGVAALLETSIGQREVGTARDPARIKAPRERRLIKLDGEFKKSQQSLAEVLSAVWLTPQMDGIFREGAVGRRRFLDRLIVAFDPHHTSHSQAYEQSLRERSRLLKEQRGDQAWFSALEDSMARHAVAIAAARNLMVERLQHAMDKAFLGSFPLGDLSLKGEVEKALLREPAVMVESRLRESLERSRDKDRQTGGASHGVHSSDLIVEYRAKAMPAGLCSTGEQKALLLSLVLTHARLVALENGSPPLLLLDEVVAHLDAQRRQELFEAIENLKLQAWMTGTDIAFFGSFTERSQVFTVENGALKGR